MKHEAGQLRNLLTISEKPNMKSNPSSDQMAVNDSEFSIYKIRGYFLCGIQNVCMNVGWDLNLVNKNWSRAFILFFLIFKFKFYPLIELKDCKRCCSIKILHFNIFKFQ